MLSSFDIFEFPFVSKKLVSCFVWHKSWNGWAWILIVPFFCPNGCNLCISLSSRLISRSSAILNKNLFPNIVIFFIFFYSINRIFSLLMYCSCLSSWKTSIFVFWTILWRTCSFLCSSFFSLCSYSTIFCCIAFSLFSIVVSVSRFAVFYFEWGIFHSFLWLLSGVSCVFHLLNSNFSM